MEDLFDLYTEDGLTRALETDVYSDNFYRLLAASEKYARENFRKGYIFAQIGLNFAPCSGNCKFCSMAKDSFKSRAIFEKNADEVCQEARALAGKASDIFLMTTADYSKEKFLETAALVRRALPENKKLVANIGDFGLSYAKELKDSGITGCYHVRRLREGIDTEIAKAAREKTLDAVLSSGLELYYCIEPIGREHTAREIAEEIAYSRTLGMIKYMAVMRRVCVKGTLLYGKGEITPREIAKIAATTMLAVRPSVSMNVHEPEAVTMLAGVNQLYAEYGANPRDTETATEKSRGFTVDKAEKMLADNGWQI